MRTVAQFVNILIIFSVAYADFISSPNTNPIDEYNATRALQLTIGEMLYYYGESCKELEDEDISIGNIDLKLLTKYSQEVFENITTERKNISITIKKVKKIQDTGKRTITCSSRKVLRTFTPIPTFQMEVVLNIPVNNGSINYSHNMTVKNVHYVFDVLADFNVQGAMTNNRTEVQISYGKANIELETLHFYEDSFSALSALSKATKLSLQAAVEKVLPNLLREKIFYPSAFSYCMYPKQYIKLAHENFTSQQHKYYYYIKEPPATNNVDGHTGIKCSDIKLKGLWNFQYAYVEADFLQRDTVTFDLLMENLEGAVNCSYVAAQLPSNMLEYKFQIEQLLVSGEIDTIRGHIFKMDINFELIPVDIESNEYLKSLLNTIKQNIRSFMISSLSNAYSYVSYLLRYK